MPVEFSAGYKRNAAERVKQIDALLSPHARNVARQIRLPAEKQTAPPVSE